MFYEIMNILKIEYEIYLKKKNTNNRLIGFFIILSHLFGIVMVTKTHNEYNIYNIYNTKIKLKNISSIY